MMSPNELKLCVEASNDRMIAERERDIWMAWHTAYLHRIDLKYFPKLSDLYDKLKPARKQDAGSGQRSSVGIDLMNAMLKLPMKIATKPGQMVDESSPDFVGPPRPLDTSQAPSQEESPLNGL